MRTEEVSASEFVAHLYPDWTLVEFIKDHEVWANCHETGEVMQVPDSRCPFVVFGHKRGWL